MTDDDMAVDIIAEQILRAIKSQDASCDRTYISVVKEINKDGTYTVNDRAGTEHKVKCCIPNLTINVGKAVWVKEPCGNISKLHICGLA